MIKDLNPPFDLYDEYELRTYLFRLSDKIIKIENILNKVKEVSNDKSLDNNQKIVKIIDICGQ